MLARFLLLFVSLCASLTVSGCFFGPTPPQRDLDEQFYLALDIETEITLRSSSELAGRPAELERVKAEKGSGLEVSDVTYDSSSVSFRIKGTKTGSFELDLKYRDDQGRRQRQTFSVEVRKLDHTSVLVPCDQNAPGRGSYWIPPGAAISYVKGGYDHEGNPLPLGELEPVKDPGEFRREGKKLVAPQEPGRYTWKLEGSTETEVEFFVYELEDLAPEFEVPDRTADEQTRLVVRTKLDDAGTEACLLPSKLSVALSATAGGCVPIVGRLKFESGTSFDLSSGGASVTLQGEEACTIEAKLSSGGRGETEVMVAIEESPSWTDAPSLLAAADPVEVVSVPEGSILSTNSQSRCLEYSVYRASTVCDSGFVLYGEAPQQCISKTNWHVNYFEFGESGDYSGTGAGLTTELEVALEVRGGTSEVRGMMMPPTDLQASVDLSEFDWQELDCTDESRVFRLTPPDAGEHEVVFDAANASREEEYTIYVQEIAQTELEETEEEGTPPVDVAPEEAPDTEAPPAILTDAEGSTRHFFVGERRPYRLQYFAGTGDRLRGLGPVFVQTSDEEAGAGTDPGSTQERFEVFVGTAPNVLSVTSPLAPGSHRIFAEGEEGIAGIHGVQDSTLLLGGEIPDLWEEQALGLLDETVYCVHLTPLADDGLLIDGKWPSLPKVAGVVGELVVSTTEVSPDGSACLIPREVGTADLTWTWGNAEKTTSWTVE